MKVGVPTTMLDEPVRGEPSFTGRLVRFMIWILLVPVRLSEDGRASFSICSWRCIFSFICWSLPFIISLVAYILSLLILLIEYSLDPTLEHLSIFTLMITFMIASGVLPIGLGYLVGSPELKVPFDLVSTGGLKIFLFWIMSSVNLFVPDLLQPETFEADNLFFKIPLTAIFFNLYLGLLLLKVYVSAFQHQAKLIESYSTSALVQASTRLLILYQSVKRGCGPLFIVIYAFCTMFLIIVLFQVTKGFAPPTMVMLGVITQTLTLYEISGYGQDLHTIMCSASSFVR